LPLLKTTYSNFNIYSHIQTFVPSLRETVGYVTGRASGL